MKAAASIREALSTGLRQADTLGAVHFEIANHLGNVVAVVSDRKIAVDSLSPFAIDHFLADRIMLRDYYAFGMTMPGRSWAVDSSYRFGFNGKEKMLGLNGLDFGARVMDVRLGRLLSIDPMADKYPDLSPYAYVANNPIIFIDPNGEEIKVTKNKNAETGKTVVTIAFTAVLIDYSSKGYTENQMKEYSERMSSALEQFYSGANRTINGESVEVRVESVIVPVSSKEDAAQFDNYHTIEIANPENMNNSMSSEGVGYAPYGGMRITLNSNIMDMKIYTDSKMLAERALGAGFSTTLERTFAHEFGHSAGLLHPNDPNAPYKSLYGSNFVPTFSNNLMWQSNSPYKGANVTDFQIEEIIINHDSGNLSKSE